MDITIWILIAIAFIILELITTSFFLVWFGISSIVAAILNYLGFDVNVQIATFIILSLVLILSTRKFANKITPESSKKTTAERLIGKNAKVLRIIDETTFVVNVAGEEWSAHSNDSIEVGETVKVVGINSIILIIEKIED